MYRYGNKEYEEGEGDSSYPRDDLQKGNLRITDKGHEAVKPFNPFIVSKQGDETNLVSYGLSLVYDIDNIQ